MDRYLVPAHGPDEEQLAVALIGAIEASKKHSCGLTIMVPALKYAEYTILERIIGEKFVRNLRKGNTGNIEGVSVKMVSKRTINPFSEYGVILSLWGGKEALDKVDKAKSAKAIVALPWIPEDVKTWEAKWNPVVLKINQA